jgi:hypothetical protein
VSYDADDLQKRVADALFRLSAFAAISAKAGSFRNEREWRICAYTDEPSLVRRRTTHRGEIHYIELPLRTEQRPILFERVTVGRAAPLYAELKVRSILEAAGYGIRSTPMPEIRRAS